DGAIVKHNETIYNVRIPEVPIVNTTGCGDSTVGGMAYAISQNFSIEDAIKYAMACGISNAQFETNGTIDKEQLKTFIPDIRLEKIAAVSSKH
ncbi:MAG: PfkB family carbohydrate kinase, partial [Enterococcus sp.]|nr:PfkB family carbohydrate kinase [Enterococcus sp.]